MLKYRMIKVSAPGKICIAGEWAVLEKGNPLIVAALDKRIFAEIDDSGDEFIHVFIEDFGIKDLRALFKGGRLIFERNLDYIEKKHTLFIKSAIESSLRYLKRSEPFIIRTRGGGTKLRENGEIKNIGFGSSAASTVAVVAAVFKFFGEDIEKEELKERMYKLSAVSHYSAQGKAGSGFDIAASVFGGTSVYKRFDSEWLESQLKEEKELRKIVEMKWPGFYIEKLKTPEDFNLLLGWTGESSSTPEMIRRLEVWKEGNPADYGRIINQIKFLVEELITAWKANNRQKILELIRKNEDYLRELGRKSSVNIETKTLALLSEIANENQAAGKLSGAGGGDCGIAATFSKESSERIKEEWGKNGIYFVDAKLSLHGVREEN